MAACRTVLPFSTVTCWPSMVSVTVSITQPDHIRSPTARLTGTSRTRDHGFHCQAGPPEAGRYKAPLANKPEFGLAGRLSE